MLCQYLLAELIILAERDCLHACAFQPKAEPADKPAKEIGGRGGLDPTRYGDWEKGGLAVDF